MILAQGLWLMAVGITVVFAFLILLVLMMYLSAAFFERFAAYFPDPPEADPPKSAQNTHNQIAAALAVLRHTLHHTRHQL